MDFLFFIGRTFEIALAELEAVLLARFPASTSTPLTPTVIKVSGLSEADAITLQSILGGTIKVAKLIEVLGDVASDEIERSFASMLATLSKEKKKIGFGVAEQGRDTLKAVSLHEIKEILRENGIQSRFVEGNRVGLSASILLHQNVEECVCVRTNGQVYVGYTVAVQNIDDWTIRDRSKPAVDRKHGMLPPKVARMMVNLALPAGGEGKRLLDPFCGTGTLVLEAMMMGAEGIGSDLRIEAAGQTQKNAEWLQSTYSLTVPFRAVVADTTHLTAEMLGGKVNAIAAEGYLGAQTPRPGAVPNQMRGLEKLYKGAFKQWTQILAEGSRICIALPRMQAGKTSHSLSGLVDSLSEFGYTSLSGPFIYDRPDAIVSREIFVLQYKK